MLPPLFRTMDQITAEEMEQWRDFQTGIKLADNNTEKVRAEAVSTKYLMSIGIDVFGWIDQGRAIKKV